MQVRSPTWGLLAVPFSPLCELLSLLPCVFSKVAVSSPLLATAMSVGVFPGSPGWSAFRPFYLSVFYQKFMTKDESSSPLPLSFPWSGPWGTLLLDWWRFLLCPVLALSFASGADFGTGVCPCSLLSPRAASRSWHIPPRSFFPELGFRLGGLGCAHSSQGVVTSAAFLGIGLL